ncbi:MAG: right-handed parallel beta-helix repeat-containing protein [Phycisphaerae bacterium]|nr:right-handed parallel beta-helix repeat-containing protein [Phycisphaerae bacterium]
MKATILLGFGLLLFAPLAAAAATRLVPGQYLTIQQAIDDSNAGDRVIIAPGRYTGDGNREIDFLGKVITVQSSDPDDAGIVAATIIDCNGIRTAFIFQGRERADSVLAGLTITRAADHGVLCDGSSPSIHDCRFVRNSGGGIAAYTANPVIADCTFLENSNLHGGAIHNDSSSLTIIGCTFIGNVAEGSGGAISGGVNSVIDCTFTANRAGFDGGAISSVGAAAIVNCTFTLNFGNTGAALDDVTSATISECTFARNVSDYGGALYVRGNASINRCTFTGNLGHALYMTGSPKVTDCAFLENRGSAIFCRGSANSLFERCLFKNNRSEGHGGAVVVYSSGRLRLTDCMLIDNYARYDGSAVYCEDYARAVLTNCVLARNGRNYGSEAVFLKHDCELTATNCTFVAGIPGSSSAIAWFSRTRLNTVRISNSILWGGNGQIYDDAGSIVDVSFSNVEGGYAGEGNISVDPGFALGGDFHLTPDSPCLDAGSNGISALPSTDIDGNLRILDAGLGRGPVIDMGAYEYNPDRPAIAISADRITFVHGWPEPEEQTRDVRIRNCGGRALNWRIEHDCEWLRLTPSSGLSTDNIDQLTITLEPLDLEPGFYSCFVSVVDETAINSPVNIDVALHVPGALHVPAEHATIQDAIDIALDYDVIIVADGIYSGEGNCNIDYRGKPLTIMSENGPEKCIVDCNGTRYERFNGFVFLDGEDANSVLDGFTITNADEHAIYCYRAGATVRNCIMNNGAASAIRALRGADLTVTNCIISDNAATNGGAIYSYSSHTILSNCLIYNNTAIEEGGAIYSRSGSTTLTNCTITANSTPGIGGGIRTEFYNRCVLKNCIVYDNPTGSGPQISATYSCCDSEVEVAYSNIQGGWPGAGNIDGNPLFMNPAGGDFHLSADSPCIDAGDPNYVPFPDQTDIDGEPRILNSSVDMGADELPYDGPLIAVWPGTFEFFAYEAGSNPSTQALSVFYIGLPGPGWEVTEDCDWLEVAALPESEANDLEVIVDVSGMPGGYYHCGFTITDPAAENSPRVVPVDLHVLGPVMEVSTTQVEFFAERGGPNPQDQSFTIHNSGGGTLSWAITFVDVCSWLGVAPTAGESVGEIDDIILSAEVSELTVGSYACSLEVSDLDAASGRHTVTVVIHIFDHTLHVPLQFPTIQGAIDHVLEGGTVIVADGIYTGEGNRNIDFKGKAITVRSENGPESCIIDCFDPEYYGYRGFVFHSGEDGNSVLSGFTVTNGVVGSCPRSPGGGGILCSLSSPTITDCIIVNNAAWGWCVVMGSAGGGIFLDQSNPTIANCIIVGNRSTEGGEGAGIFCLQSSPIITNCTICDNSGDGITSCYMSNPVIVNCIFWGNSSEQIVVESDEFSSAVVAFSNVQDGQSGLGNIAEDPCFVSHGYFEPNGHPYYIYDDTWVDGDYHLMSEGWRSDMQRGVWTWDDVTSRCIDAGNPASPLGDEPLSIPADPNNDWGRNIRINMGTYGGTSQASIPPHGWSILTDQNNDGIVNFTDLACRAEIQAGTAVAPALKFADLALLANRWLDQTTWFTIPSPGPNLPASAASNPNPPDGSPAVRTDPVLSWQGGFDAISHDIYFGASNPPAFQANQAGTTFDPGLLSGLTTYYWRIDEVKPYGTTLGPVWSFTTTTSGRR